MQNEPIVEETRKIRNRLAAKFKYDLKALEAYYQSKQTAENRVIHDFRLFLNNMNLNATFFLDFV